MNLFLKISAPNLVITFLTIISFCSPVRAQEQNYQIRSYSSDEGFTGGSFKRIVQDSLGFLWVGTGTGIYSFDGYEFHKTPLIINTPREFAFSIDPLGDPWTGGPGRLLAFVRNDNRFREIKVPSQGQRIISLAFSGNSKVWIGTDGQGLLSLDRSNDSISFKRNDLDPQANTIFDIVNVNGILFLGTSNGLWKFDPDGDRFSRLPTDEKEMGILRSGSVKKIFSYPGFYWLLIDQQFIKIQSNGVILSSLSLERIQREFDPEKKFGQAGIVSIAEDKDGKFWIATSGLGLIFYDPYKDKLQAYRSNKDDVNSPPSDFLCDVMVDRDRNVWVSTVNKGIFVLKKQSLTFFNYLNGISSTGIGILPSGESRQLVVATNGSGLWTSDFDVDNLANLNFSPFKIQSTLAFENIIELHIGKKDLWLGSLNSGVVGIPVSKDGLASHKPSFEFYSGNGDQSISYNFISALWEDAKNHLWIGTLGSGLNVGTQDAKSKSWSFKVFHHDESEKYSISHDAVRLVYPQSDGSILVATIGGLDRISNPLPPYHQLKFEHVLKDAYCNHFLITSEGNLLVCTKEGLLEGTREGSSFRFEKVPLPGNPTITFVEEDLLGRIWCMSQEGLFFYDRKNKFVLQFMKGDGLPSSRSVMAARSCQTPEGIMVFSNAEGLTIFNPLSLRINDAKPKPVITQLKINNEAIAPKTSNRSDFSISESISTISAIELKHTHNILELQFSAMDMTAPEKNQYKYMLENFNETWVQTDWKNRTATYTNLHPGNYTFKVMATNRDGVWSDHVATLKIVVLPAPWNTWWAYSFYGLIILGMLYYARRSILKEERLKATLKIEQVELEKKQMELLKVQEVDKLKSSFFTNISHEFRTPLTLIQGPVQLLLEKFSADPKIKRQLQLVQNNVQLLLKLINQLLELSRLESGNLSIENTQIDLDAFIHSVVNYFESQAREKNISIHLDLSKVSHSLSVDKGKLETILINLVGNAMKFTPDHGHVSIKARIEGDEHLESGDIRTLCIVVADNGIGIPEDKQSLIFDRFFQVSETHNQIGTGIGLALVKELSQLLEGSINVESKPGVGSQFVLKVPVHVLTSSPVHQIQYEEANNDSIVFANEHNGSTSNGNVPKILVVEDNHDLRQFIIDSFDGVYQFTEASNGSEGLNKAIHEIPELIISDIMMPEMDGITMSGKIKKDIRTCHIPILFLTAKATEKSKLSGLETGAEDYLTKPFNKDELILKVRNIISSRERIREKLRIELLNEAPVVVAQSSDEQFLIKVKEVIHQRLSDPKLGVDIICLEVGFSRAQLYRKVTALTGVSVNELIRTFRLKRAAQLLNQNWGAVSEVAYEVGFSNLSYFSKCFKDEFGVLPSAYHHSEHPT